MHGQVAPVFSNASTQNPSNINGDSPVTDLEWYAEITKRGCLSMGAIFIDGEYYVCSFLGTQLYILKVDLSGGLNYWKRLALPSQYNQFSVKRAELEMVKDGNIVKVATELGLHNVSAPQFNSNQFVYLELNNNLTAINNQIIHPIPGDIHGIEFSPNKSFVYYTMSIPSFDSGNPALLYPNINVYDISQNSFSSLFDITNPIQQFKFSYIERGVDDNLYFATANGLHRLINPNVPTINGLSTNPVISMPINASYSGQIIPSAMQKSFALPDQMDEYDYSFSDNLQCCIATSNYDIKYFQTASNATWQAGVATSFSTSLPQTITIRDELRVKAGTTLTLNNMTLRFAPGARLVVENGTVTSPTVYTQGGKLILNGTTLTVEDGCAGAGNALWLGVEVWGNTNQSQNTWLNTSQGRLEMNSNSKIEHAYIGVLVGKRKTTELAFCDGVLEEQIELSIFDPERNGGIAKVNTGSTFFDNKWGMHFQPYSNNGLNNLSWVRRGSFIWSGVVLNGFNYVKDHIKLEGVKGISILGTMFLQQNNNFAQNNDGVGINSTASQFTVGKTGSIGCTFINLSYGIQASSPSVNHTFQSDQALYRNCSVGIAATTVNNLRITKNNFIIRQAEYQTHGIRIEKSTAYVIQENVLTGASTNFSLDHLQSHAISITNSGKANNLVYKNTIGNATDESKMLQRGIYAFGINGVPVAASYSNAGLPALSTGLQMRCNDFLVTSTYEADLAIYGTVNYMQGNSNLPAANLFSKNYLVPHDILLTPTANSVLYYLPNNQNNTAGTMIPDSYTAPPQLHFLSSTLLYDAAKHCPSQLGKPIGTVISVFQSANAQLKPLEAFMKGGDAAQQLAMIAANANSQPTLDTLFAHSPFLSDAVLIAYLNSSASQGHKKQIILANVQLSEVVMQAVMNSNLPNGAKNQISSSQNSGVSLKSATIEQYNALQMEADENYYEALSRLMLDSTSTGTYQQAIEFIKARTDNQSIQMQMDFHLANNEIAVVDSLRTLLDDQELENVFDEFHDLKKEIKTYQTVHKALENPAIENHLIQLSNTSDPLTKARCEAFLAFKYGQVPAPDMPPLQSNAMMLQTNNESQETTKLLPVISIYPNPSTGLVYFDYPTYEEGTLQIEVFDYMGKQVHSQILGSDTNGEAVNLSQLHKGLYLVRVSMDNTILETKRLILE